MTTVLLKTGVRTRDVGNGSETTFSFVVQDETSKAATIEFELDPTELLRALGGVMMRVEAIATHMDKWGWRRVSGSEVVTYEGYCYNDAGKANAREALAALEAKIASAYPGALVSVSEDDISNHHRSVKSAEGWSAYRVYWSAICPPCE